MQNTSNDIKHRYNLILHSILILHCDFCFNFNLKLNNDNDTDISITHRIPISNNGESGSSPTRYLAIVGKFTNQRIRDFLQS